MKENILATDIYGSLHHMCRLVCMDTSSVRMFVKHFKMETWKLLISHTAFVWEAPQQIATRGKFICPSKRTGGW
jgi:hypothetical protein